MILRKKTETRNFRLKISPIINRSHGFYDILEVLAQTDDLVLNPGAICNEGLIESNIYGFEE
jgi:hypothetical protein